jgi:hypothetical protein
MQILKEPTSNGLHFHSSIPDIIIQKNDASVGIIFEMIYAGVVILKEQFSYDSNSLIQIQNISEIVESYFPDDLITIPTTDPVYNPGLTDLAFTYRLTEGTTIHESTFNVLRCDAEVNVNVSEWITENFLSRAYRSKRTAINWNEYLSYYQQPAAGELTVNYKIVYKNDGITTEAIGVFKKIPAAVSNRIVTFNTSLRALLDHIELDINTTVLQYDFWITGTDVSTNNYTYLVDRNTYRSQTNFVFVNSFGVIETFTATGELINNKTNDIKISNINNHYRKTENNFLSQKQCFSGFLSEREMDWIDDMTMSYALGLYTYAGLSDEITIVKTEKSDTNKNELHAFSFEYRRAKNTHFVFGAATNGIFDLTFDQTFD